jgi:HlyD family secretion protein
MNVAQVTARQPVTAGRTTGRVNQLLVVAVAMAAAVGGSWPGGSFGRLVCLWASPPVTVGSKREPGNTREDPAEIDTAAKIAGRIKEIYADEGDFVTAGQPLARMDMATLEAQRREEEAKLHAAIVNVDTARSRVAQREAEKSQT